MARETHVSPRGELHWAKVLGEPAENKADKTKPRAWSVELHFPIDHPDALRLTQLAEDAFLSAHGSQAKVSKNGWPFSEVLDKEEKPTGVLRFRFSSNETGKSGRAFAPPTVVDAKKRRWPADVLIGNGSTGKVAFTIFAWTDSFNKAGVSFGLEGVQLLTHVPYSGGGALAAFEEEDGVEAPASAAAAAPASAEEKAWPASEEEVPF